MTIRRWLILMAIVAAALTALKLAVPALDLTSSRVLAGYVSALSITAACASVLVFAGAALRAYTRWLAANWERSPAAAARFVVTTESFDALGIAGLLERFANREWVPDHLSHDKAVAWIVDQFKQTVATEIEMAEIRCLHLMADKSARDGNRV